MNLYNFSIIFILIFGGTIFYTSIRKKLLSSFNLRELIIIALFWSLLYVAILPFKFGLSRLPFIHAFFFSIPYSAVLIIGIKLVPKFGTATLLIFGSSLLRQITSSGINPLWWPYALLSGFVLEAYFLITKNYLNSMANVIGAGILRGLIVYLYFYFIAAPFIWHKFYASWYIFIQTLQGVIGSSLGALIGFTLSKSIFKGFQHGGM